eukprot:gene6492-8926_t
MSVIFLSSVYSLRIARKPTKSLVPIISGLNLKCSTSKILCMMSDSKSDIKWPVDQVRTAFVDYFVSKHNHINYKSSPCVPVNDPTLLFANAGMNQFKPIFIGTVDPSSPLSSLTRVVNSQKCIRAGGKHNDLDDVGKDTYHHTFFEMLGTWSFGNYFKKEAIDWAYDILVNTYQLDPNRLYASYFAGDESLGLPCDDEARQYWLKYLPAERVLPFDKKANFWEMGDSGPCGPCSEIHYDRIGGRDAAAFVNADDPDVIEIWNLVFIQYNRELNGELRQLPNKHIDTGMGLERLTSILQDKRSNYDTDVFMPIFKAIENIIGCKPYQGKLGDEDAAQNYRDTAYRVVADHVRTLTFAITDGAVPSNEGRGYVLRRILRRAVRYGIQTLGAKPGFFSQLVPIVGQQLGGAFPELLAKKSDVMALITEEEMAFTYLLEKGVKYFGEVMNEVKSSGGQVIDGEKAFYLYDTLGFPIDLTQIIAAENGFQVDLNGFQLAMNTQKERSRTATRTKRLAGRAMLALGVDDIANLNKANIAPTDDSFKYTLGEDTCLPLIGTKIQAIYTEKGPVDEISDDTNSVGIVLSATPFYAESGGQAPDNGIITFINNDGKEVQLEVLDVQVYGGYVLHTCSPVGDMTSLNGLKVGSRVDARVDRRRKVAVNHTMTHVLNFALRKVLKENVIQKGSAVTEDKLRFDFSLNRGVQLDELKEIEQVVNDVIRKKLFVDTKVVSLKSALEINGLRAVFGEVYPDPVRVVSVGPRVDDLIKRADSEEWVDYSVEFCGGTHITNTDQAEAFIVLEETAVAKGIRRISAITGSEAVKSIAKGKMLSDAAMSVVGDMKKTSAATSMSDLENIESDMKTLRALWNIAEDVSQVTKTSVRQTIDTLQKEVSSLKNNAVMKRVDEIVKMTLQNVEVILSKNERLVVLNVNIGSDMKAIKRLIEGIKKASNDQLSFIVLSYEVSDLPIEYTGKLTVFGYVSNDEQKKSGLKANEWVSFVLQSKGGKGGGSPSLAQGSLNINNGDGHNEMIDELTEAAKSFIKPFQSLSV